MKRLKVKNALSALISRLNTVKERIKEHEDRSTEITQSETQQKKRKRKIDQNIQELWSNITGLTRVNKIFLKGPDNKCFRFVGSALSL